MTHRNLTAWRHFRTLLSLGLLAGALPLACGSDPEIDFSPDDVGRSCEGDDDCNGDLVCSAGACSIPCGTDAKNCTAPQVCLGNVCSIGIGSACEDASDCKGELVCSSTGHCAIACEAGTKSDKCGGKECRADGTCPLDGGLDIGDGEGGAGGQGGGEDCIDVDVEFTPQIPTVLLLIDRSGSMNAAGGFGDAVDDAVDAGEYELGDCPSNNDWRWNVVRDVLLNPEKGVVKPLESRVRFGLSLYTSLDGDRSSSDPTESDPSKECPMLEEVDYGLNNHADMLDAFQCSDFVNNGDTPTGPALLAVAESLSGFDEPGPKVIVLATDGEPDDCECPDFSGSHVPSQCKGANQAAAMQRVKDDVVEFAGQIHADDDIIIHVINVSSPDNAGLQTHLADVAEAGGGNVYPGFNPGDLSEAFEDIIYGARSCKIDLDGSIAAGKESTGVVRLDGTVLELDDPDGFRVNNPKQIELRGDACDTIKSGDHDLTIKFPCDSFIPVPR